jgi:hypothetical protein
MPALNTQLNVSDGRLTAILDAMLLGVVIIDPWTHTIIYANDEAAGMMDRQVTDILGHVCHNFICPVAVGSCPITDLGQKLDRSERCVLDRRSIKLPILKTVRKIEFEGRIHYLEMFMDISEIKEKERMQGVLEMAGAATHHLGQPLQVLTTCAELLLKPRSPETIRRLNLKIEHAINQIKRIIIKIQNITQYHTEEYIEGKRIVDISRSSSINDGPSPADPEPIEPSD